MRVIGRVRAATRVRIAGVLWTVCALLGTCLVRFLGRSTVCPQWYGAQQFDSRTSPINSVWLMVPLLSASADMNTLSMALSLRFPSFFLSALCSFFAACEGEREPVSQPERKGYAFQG